MKKPGRSFASPDEQVPSHAHSDNSGCYAAGCPLPGTWSDSTKGDGPWFCYLHSSVKASRRDEVTGKIHENVWIYRLYERVMKSDPTQWTNVKQLSKQFCERRNEPDLAPKIDEKRTEYERRLRMTLEKRCRPAKQVDTFDQDAAAVAKGSSGMLSDFLPAAA